MYDKKQNKCEKRTDLLPKLVSFALATCIRMLHAQCSMRMRQNVPSEAEAAIISDTHNSYIKGLLRIRYTRMTALL